MIKKIIALLKRGQRGMALPMALVLLVAASIIVVPSLWAVQSLLTINSNVSRDTLAYYAAEAGVADLVWKYKYSTAPTAPYTLNNINGMDVDITPVKTSGQDYYWMSSAESDPVGRAQVYVHIRQTGSQGSNIFEYAALSLGGDITLGTNKKIIITSDDVLSIHNCDTVWARVPSTVGCAKVSSPRASGLYYDTAGYSARMVMTNAMAGNLAYRNITALNISDYEYVKLWIQSTRALNEGELVFKLATGNNLSGTVQTLPLPYVPVNAGGTRVLLSIPNQEVFTGLRSIGIQQTVSGPLSYTVYIDSVVATNNISDGDIFANGNCNIAGTVMGDASATGAVIVNQWNGKLWGTATPNSPAYVPQNITVENYVSESMAGTLYSAPPSWGTIYIGPGHYNGDVTFGGSLTVYIQGPIYASGSIEIANSAVVSGAYPIVAENNVTISGDARAQLAKDAVPLIVARNGDISVSGSSAASAMLYAPNGTATISGGTPSPPGFNVYGSVVAKDVNMSGSTTIKYMTGVRTLPWPPGWGLGGGPAGGGGTTVTTVLGYDYR